MACLMGLVHSPIWPFACLVLTQFLAMVTSENDPECVFMDNAANCAINVANKSRLYVTARINECSRPVDVTVSLKAENSTWSWKHTFANHDEVQPLPGLLGKDSNIYLQMGLHSRPGNRLHVLGRFDVSSRPAQVFIDDIAKIMGLVSCAKPGNPNAYLPLVVFIVLIILIFALIITIVGFRRHVVIKRHGNLLSNMEPASTSYHDEPAIISSSTTIKNEIYRDTVISIADDDRNRYSNAPVANNDGADTDSQGQPLPPPVNGRKKRGLRHGLPQPVLEQLPEESGEDEGSSSCREMDPGINPSITVNT